MLVRNMGNNPEQEEPKVWYLVFTVTRIPDLTLAKYSVLDGSGVDDIMDKHGVFLRQLHRLGSLSRVYFHLLYWYDPDPRIPRGHHLSVVFYATSPDRSRLAEIRAFLTTSVLSSYYDFHCFEITDKFETDVIDGQDVIRLTNIAGAERVYGIGEDDPERIQKYAEYMKSAEMKCLSCELASDGDAVLSWNYLKAYPNGRVQFSAKHVLCRRLRLVPAQADGKQADGKPQVLLRAYEGAEEDSRSADYPVDLTRLTDPQKAALRKGIISPEGTRYACLFGQDSDTVVQIRGPLPCDGSGSPLAADRAMERRFAHGAFLTKKDYDLPALNLLPGEKDASLYAIMEWEPSDTGRLYNVLKLMEGYARTAALRIDIFPAEMTQRIRSVLPYQSTRARIAQRNQGKDDNSENIIRAWDKYLQNLVKFPQFFANVTAFADTEDIAAMLVDSVAAEAVESGTYMIRTLSPGELIPALSSDKDIPGGYDVYYGDQTPLNRVHAVHPERNPREDYISQFLSLYTLEELRPMFSFPILYPGESIECLKETDPAPDDGKRGETLSLGVSALGYNVDFPIELFRKHAFIAGVPGAGKTNTMLHLVTSLWRDAEKRVPFLVLEPAKQEYRALANIEGMEELRIFSPGADTNFPLHINPFQFPVGLTLAEHIANLNAVFAGAFELPPPSPHFIDTCIEQVYINKGWNVNERNTLKKDIDGKYGYRHDFPTMQELYDSLEVAVKNSHYQGETLGNLQSVLEVRVGSLLKREIGNVYNVRESSLRPEEWLDVPAIIELESLGEGPANFMSLLLSTLIRETLKVRKLGDGWLPQGPAAMARRNPELSHVIFYEEAHNLVGPDTDSPAGDSVDPKISATKYLVKMLAEVRALNEGIVIADQLPTVMAPEVLKNTGLKIAHRITAQDDRSLLGSTMSASGDQLEEQGIFGTGQALIFYEGLQKPYKMKVHAWDRDNQDKGRYDSKSNRELSAYLLQRGNRVYLEQMIKSAAIMTTKLNGEFDALDQKAKKLRSDLDAEGKALSTSKRSRAKEDFLTAYDRKIRMLCRSYVNQYYSSVTLAVNYELQTDDQTAAGLADALYAASLRGFLTLFERLGDLSAYPELADALVSETQDAMQDTVRFLSLEDPERGRLFCSEYADGLLYVSCYFWLNRIRLETKERSARAEEIADSDFDQEEAIRTFCASWTDRFTALLAMADRYAAAADALAAAAEAAAACDSVHAWKRKNLLLEAETRRRRRFELYHALHPFVIEPFNKFNSLHGAARGTLLEATDPLRMLEYRKLVHYRDGTAQTRLSACSEYARYRKEAALIAQIELLYARESDRQEAEAIIQRMRTAGSEEEKCLLIREIKILYTARFQICFPHDVPDENYRILLLEYFLQYLDRMMDLGSDAVREIRTDQYAREVLDFCEDQISTLCNAASVTEKRVNSWKRVQERWISMKNGQS